VARHALAAANEFRSLPQIERQIVFAAVLLHDVAKPHCTRQEGERLSSRGHSSRGENLARQILWRERVPFRVREAVCGLVRHHQVPFFLIERDDAEKLAYRVSHLARCDHLALVAWADGRGRRCANDDDQRRILDNVALFSELCAEHRCLTGPRKFPSDHSRFLYFHKDDRDPRYLAFDDTTFEVTLMSGLPGAGKDHWLRVHASGLPCVSLDVIREQLGIDPGDSQGRVIDEARQRAREYLRKQQSFAWNATNLSGPIRQQLIALFAGYNARVRIVYVECPRDRLLAQNASRPSPVPGRVIDKLLSRWTVPSTVEAQEVVYSVEEA
jgi:predicted kinase